MPERGRFRPYGQGRGSIGPGGPGPSPWRDRSPNNYRGQGPDMGNSAAFRMRGPPPFRHMEGPMKRLDDLPLNPMHPMKEPRRLRTNDVEIIVTRKSLTPYAEFVERRLRNNGLSVDLLFPNEEVPLGRVFGNISNRGSLFGLVVNVENEEKKSVTVAILHGEIQEHRNVPIDDAVKLVMNSFEAYTRGDKSACKPLPGAIPVNSNGVPLGERHPDAIQALFAACADNKPISDGQLDTLIRYLQDKRSDEKQGNENPKSHLENKILSLLSKEKIPSETPRLNVFHPF